MIKYAAILINQNSGFPIIITGNRHSDCFKTAASYNIDRIRCMQAEQGFINDKMQFINRENAAIEAYTCGQILELKKELFSEDLY